MNKPSNSKQLNTEATCRQLLNHEPMTAVAIIALDENGDLYTSHCLHPSVRSSEVNAWKKQLQLYVKHYAAEIY